jgi:hypothetical protein
MFDDQLPARGSGIRTSKLSSKGNDSDTRGGLKSPAKALPADTISSLFEERGLRLVRTKCVNTMLSALVQSSTIIMRLN